MDTAWIWELSGYCAKYSFLTEPKGLTMREVERIFQLDPEPPVHENLNDYIIKAVQSRELCWFSFFLHHYENRLNGRIRRFLLREGLDRYDPERFLDYKMGCVLAGCRRRPVPLKMWMSTKLCAGLLGSIINPDNLNRRRFRNMPRNITVQMRPQRSFWRWQSKTETVFRFTRPYRTRTVKKPARMSAGMTTGIIRRFYGTASRLKLSGRHLKS